MACSIPGSCNPGYLAQRKGDLEKARSSFRESLSIQQEVGNKQGIAECLAGLADLAAVEKQAQRALRLFAASRALLEVIQLPLSPADVLEWQRDDALARSQLDEPACKQAWEEGRKMPLEQALELALA